MKGVPYTMCKENFSKKDFSNAKKGSTFAVIIILLTLLLVGIVGCIGFLKLYVSQENLEKRTEPYTVGILSGLDFFSDTIDGFKEQMTTLGYIEGKNINYIIQKTNFEPENERAILEKFVSVDKVDLIFVFPTEVSLLAKEVVSGSGIPILFANASIDGVNLIEKISTPGNNMTGVRFPGTDLAVKRLETFLEIFPNIKRVLVPHQKDYPIVAPELNVLSPVMEKLGIELVVLPASSIDELKMGLDSLERSNKKIDAILMIPEPLTVKGPFFTLLAEFAVSHKIPIGGASITVGNYESLFGISSDNFDTGSDAAILANKIFNGSNAGTIPIATPESRLELNQIAAQKLGIIFPDGLLSRATKIYQ